MKFESVLPVLDIFPPVSVNGVTIVLGIFLDFSPTSLNLSQHFPVDFLFKPILIYSPLSLSTTIILGQSTLISFLYN